VVYTDGKMLPPLHGFGPVALSVSGAKSQSKPVAVSGDAKADFTLSK